MAIIKLFTIGFTKRTAKSFFTTLKQEKVSRIIDVRLNNISQLSGFAKKKDLIYFLNELCASEYVHKPQFAPTKKILDDFKKKRITWTEYERQFFNLIKERSIENLIQENELENACLLCSEPTPEHCHRRLVGEYFQNTFKNIKIKHL